jgi:proline dehydrogenase
MLVHRMLLYLSRSGNLERFFRHNPLTRRTSNRFFAGETREDALTAARSLNLKGFKVILDHLAEEVRSLDQARQVVAEYCVLLQEIAGRNLDAGLSVKLDSLGLRLDPEKAFEHLLLIVETAASCNRFVRVDMERSDLTDITLNMVRRVHARHANIGTVIQAQLRNSGDHVQRLVREGISVRLVKGAYRESPEVAFQNPEEIDLSFRRLAEMLLRDGFRPAIATHDEKLIDFAGDIAFIYGLSERDFEFHMLYGVRRSLQQQLLEKGHVVRIYLPYGKNWYGYFMRRLAERPDKLRFLLSHFSG